MLLSYNKPNMPCNHCAQNLHKGSFYCLITDSLFLQNWQNLAWQSRHSCINHVSSRQWKKMSTNYVQNSYKCQQTHSYHGKKREWNIDKMIDVIAADVAPEHQDLICHLWTMVDLEILRSMIWHPHESWEKYV